MQTGTRSTFQFATSQGERHCSPARGRTRRRWGWRRGRSPRRWPAAGGGRRPHGAGAGRPPLGGRGFRGFRAGLDLTCVGREGREEGREGAAASERGNGFLAREGSELRPMTRDSAWFSNRRVGFGHVFFVCA